MKLVVNGSELAPPEFLQKLWNEILVAQQLLIEQQVAWCVGIIQCDISPAPSGGYRYRHHLRVKVVFKSEDNGKEHPHVTLLGIKLPEGEIEHGTSIHRTIIEVFKTCLYQAQGEYARQLERLPKFPEELQKVIFG